MVSVAYWIVEDMVGAVLHISDCSFEQIEHVSFEGENGREGQCGRSKKVR